MGPRLRVSSERLEKPGIEPMTPGLEGEQLNHYGTEASLIEHESGIQITSTYPESDTVSAAILRVTL